MNEKLRAMWITFSIIGFLMMLNDPQSEDTDLSFLWVNVSGLVLLMLSGLMLRKK